MENKEEKNMSFHYFIWSFKIKGGVKDVQRFNKKIKECGWREKIMNFNEMYSKGSIDRDLLMINQYFSIPARDIFCGKNDVCTVFSYGEIDNINYYIEKEIKNKIKKFELPVKELELHIFRQGVGILFIGVENFDNKSNCDEFLSNVRFINDYGRRVSLPFIPSNKNISICADKIGIKDYKKCRSFVSDFSSIINKCNNEEKENEKENPMNPASFLFDIINHNLEEDRNQLIDNNIIEYFSDDRMFVMSIISSNHLSKKIKQRKGKSFFDDEKEDELYKELYKLAYIDSNDVTCQNKKMMKSLLESAYYLRWSDYGTVHSITEYSFNCITGKLDDVYDTVYRPFILEYKLIYSLIIAQKIGIQRFDERAGRIAHGVERKLCIFSDKKNKLCELQAEYVTFKNQILILEVSNQTQGIEIYNLLQKQFLIDKEEALLEQQIRSIYEIANLEFSNTVSSLGLALAGFAVFVDIFLNVVQMYEAILITDSLKLYFNMGIGPSISLFLFIFILFFLFYFGFGKVKRLFGKSRGQ